ncbi:MAG TPA: DUF5689 domain-containing protein [Chitinophagales bacterium]
MKTLKLTFTIFSLILISACVKEKFDAPPSDGEDPKGIVATTTIAQLKSLYQIGSTSPKLIADSLIICGIVNGDDKDGNLYKVISIQDSTAGIQVCIDNSFLYNTYPIGRKVFIKCQDLYIGEYAGMVQLGGYIDNSSGYRLSVGNISSVVAQDKILKGKWNQTITPLNIAIDDLDFVEHQSMLIKLSNVEFACADIFQTYADAANLGSLNRTIEDCDGNEILIRTSGFAKFAGEITPAKKGALLALFSVYKSGSNWTPQLVIRNTNDIQMTENTRCDGTQVGETPIISIAELRAMYTGTTIAAPCINKIRGVVTSYNSANNFDAMNLFLQDDTAGITVRFTTNHSLHVGDSVEILMAGAEITSYKETLELTNVATTNVTKLGVSTPHAIRLTIAQILANFEMYESMLVEIPHVSFSGSSGIYGGSVTLNDGTGTLVLFTRESASGSATFATTPYPITPKTVRGVLQQYNTTYEMYIRTTNDVY